MAIHQQGNALVCVASFLASGGGATGLAVSVDVYEIGLPSGAPSTIVTAASATEIARGLYYYRLASVNVDANALYVFAFYTLGVADQKVVVQGWTAGVGWVENVNAAVTTRASQTSLDTKASQASVDTRASQTSVDSRASQASLDAMASDVGSDLDSLLSTMQAQFTLVRAKTDQLVFTVAGKVEAAIVDAASFGQAAADKVWSTAARTLTAGVDLTTGAIASAAAAVWEVLVNTLTAPGSIGEYLVTQLAVAGGDPLGNTVPGDYPSGSAGAALGRIGSGQIQYVSPLSTDGKTMEVKRGDDYMAVDARAFAWTDTDNMWREPIASAVWTARMGDVVAVTKACNVVVPSGPGKQVQLDLTSEETAALELGTPAYRFDVELVDDEGHRETPIHGVVHVLEDQTHA